MLYCSARDKFIDATNLTRNADVRQLMLLDIPPGERLCIVQNQCATGSSPRLHWLCCMVFLSSPASFPGQAWPNFFTKPLPLCLGLWPHLKSPDGASEELQRKRTEIINYPVPESLSLDSKDLEGVAGIPTCFILWKTPPLYCPQKVNTESEFQRHWIPGFHQPQRKMRFLRPVGNHSPISES